MANAELAQTIRAYAAAQVAEGVAHVFSADLVEHLRIDPRAAAAALRPYGVVSEAIGKLGRGYMAADIVEQVPAPAPGWSRTPEQVLIDVYTEALGRAPAGGNHLMIYVEIGWRLWSLAMFATFSALLAWASAQGKRAKR